MPLAQKALLRPYKEKQKKTQFISYFIFFSFKIKIAFQVPNYQAKPMVPKAWFGPWKEGKKKKKKENKCFFLCFFQK
jgi:hypothetical protein